MPEWLAIVIGVIGLIGTILGMFGISAYVNERAKIKAKIESDNKKKTQEELDELKRQKYLLELRTIVSEENEKSVTPLKEKLIELEKKLAQLEEKLSKIEDGTLDTLRDRILSAYYKCKDKGYHTQYDYENVHHMYKDYLALDGNSFVKDCMKKFDQLPGEEDFFKNKKPSKRKAKQVLVEQE